MKAMKFSVSESETWLQPTPGLLGYSQLKSGKHERRGDVSGNTLDLLEVDSVETVFANQTKDSLNKCGTVLRVDRRRKELGSSPPADGNAGECSMAMGLLDEVLNVGGS